MVYSVAKCRCLVSGFLLLCLLVNECPLHFFCRVWLPPPLQCLNFGHLSMKWPSSTKWSAKSYEYWSPCFRAPVVGWDIPTLVPESSSFWVTECCYVLKVLLSELSSRRMGNLLRIKFGDLSPWTLRTNTKDVPYFVPVVGESSGVIKCFRPKLLPAFEPWNIPWPGSALKGVPYETRPNIVNDLILILIFWKIPWMS